MANPIILNQTQKDFLENARTGSILLDGEFGTGKTTVSTLRMLELDKRSRSSLSSTLVLAPQYPLLRPYQQAKIENQANQGQTALMTFSSLVKRNIALFWPLVADQAGFAHPEIEPKFLTIETAQFYLGQIVDPLMDKGIFSGITIPRNRIYSQLLDSLNKAAIIPFNYRGISARLKAAWTGGPEQLLTYDEVQVCLSAFRAKCLQENLLDYSLQVEVFAQLLWPQNLFRKYIRSSYSDLIYENIEEEPPLIHDLITDLLSDLNSICLIRDIGGGYRKFLGADPDSASRFQNGSCQMFTMTESLVSTPGIEAAKKLFLTSSVTRPIPGGEIFEIFKQPADLPIFVPKLLDWTVEQIKSLVDQGSKPSEIVILSPYLSSTFAFYLQAKMQALGLPSKTTKASALLRDDPLVKLFLNFYCLSSGYPSLFVTQDDIVDLLTLSLGKINRVQAKLLSNTICGKNLSIQALPELGVVEGLPLERFDPELLSRYAYIRSWLQEYDPNAGFGLFISRLFGELLTQPGYGLQGNTKAGKIAGRLIDSFSKFEQALATNCPENQKAVNFIETVRKGLLSGIYEEEQDTEDSILITPVLTFLMRNQAVDYQFWMNTGSNGWHERLEQPLTQAYVLSRSWKPGRVWTTADDAQLSKETLMHTVQGLLSRCRKKVYLGISVYDESGSQETGLLLQVLQGLFRRAIGVKSHA
jgi:hypothetical protein